MNKTRYDGGHGFRDMELFNIALLARRAWRLLTSPNTLSARILKVVYYPNHDILTTKLDTRQSKIWRAISERREMLSDSALSSAFA
jgi:hypothetical protein